MLRHLPVCAVLLLAALPAAAQDRPATEQKSGTYVVKYAAAKDLADILAKHFRGAAEIKIGPDAASNSLLINAPPTVLEEVMKTLELLDRRPRPVAIDIFVVELATKKGDDKEKRPDKKEFSGAINNVAERLDSMVKKGQVAGFRRIQLTTPEGQPSLQDLTEVKQFVMAASALPNGIITRQISRRKVGTLLKVTPRITADRSVMLTLNVEDARAQDTTIPWVPVDENGNPFFITQFVHTWLIGKISVASGQAALAKDAKVISKEAEAETLIIVGARIDEPEAKPK
jgi:type II secretory pathway component HofQ